MIEVSSNNQLCDETSNRIASLAVYIVLDL
jgi:hypothetical protein